MEIFLQSQFDTKIIIDSQQLKLTKFDCVCLENFSFDSPIVLFPNEGNVFAITLKKDNDKIFCDNPNVEIFKMPTFDFLIRFIVPTLPNLIVYESSQKRKNGECKIIVFGNPIQLLCIYHNGKLRYQKLLRNRYNNFDFEIKKFKQGDYIWFNACGEKESFLYIADDIELPIFCDYYHEQNTQNNKTKILKKFHDGKGHGEVYNFDAENFCLSREHTVFVQKRETINKFEIPYLFLESIKAQNYKLAKNYLSPDLQENLSKDKLFAFFGKFDKIEQCNFYHKENQISAYNYNDKLIEIYSFEIANKKIINIEKK